MRTPRLIINILGTRVVQARNLKMLNYYVQVATAARGRNTKFRKEDVNIMARMALE